MCQVRSSSVANRTRHVESVTYARYHWAVSLTEYCHSHSFAVGLILSLFNVYCNFCFLTSNSFADVISVMVN